MDVLSVMSTAQHKTVDAGRPERVLIGLLYALGAAVLAYWLQALAMLPASGWVWLGDAFGVVGAAGLGALLARRALPPDGHQLLWDGQAWALRLRSPANPMAAAPPTPLLSVVMTLDLGGWLLLRLRPVTGNTRWQVARSACVGAAWHGLRVALTAQSGVAVAALALQSAAAPQRAARHE